MQASEIRELTDDDIRSRIAELEEERFRLKFRAATEALENPMQLRFIRRDVARLHTVLRERELANAGGAGGTDAAAGSGKRSARGAKKGGKSAGTPARESAAPATKAGGAKRAAPRAKR
jgi:large subunit ribosomal protein L29